MIARIFTNKITSWVRKAYWCVNVEELAIIRNSENFCWSFENKRNNCSSKWKFENFLNFNKVWENVLLSFQYIKENNKTNIYFKYFWLHTNTTIFLAHSLLPYINYHTIHTSLDIEVNVANKININKTVQCADKVMRKVRTRNWIIASSHGTLLFLRLAAATERLQDFTAPNKIVVF